MANNRNTDDKRSFYVNYFSERFCDECHRLVSQGKRILQIQELMNEFATIIEDPAERNKIQEGMFGRMLQSTQVYEFHFHNCFVHSHSFMQGCYLLSGY